MHRQGVWADDAQWGGGSGIVLDLDEKCAPSFLDQGGRGRSLDDLDAHFGIDYHCRKAMDIQNRLNAGQRLLRIGIGGRLFDGLAFGFQQGRAQQ